MATETQTVERRLLELAEKGIAEGSYSDDGALYMLAVSGSYGPAIVAALCRVVEAAREMKHEDWHDAPMAQSWGAVAALTEALAALDRLPVQHLQGQVKESE